VSILGIPIDSLTEDEAVARIQDLVESGGSHQVVTVNPEFVMAARKTPRFRRTLSEASLSLADGVGILMASRWLGQPVSQRVAGVDMVWRIADLAARRGYGIYCLGAAPGVAREAAGRLTERYPDLRITGCHSGSPDEAEESEIADRIRVAGPHILLVAYGAPEQDLWISRNMGSLGVPLAMGVGGAFDFISGRASRAPLWMRNLGLEWLHRLVREPWRWRRMLALPRFAALVFWARWRSDGRASV
jgi:N-acetylglucosaminyldiphosphoundecaprenol N-acetyl-beta-D-mannosaminyltransferase